MQSVREDSASSLSPSRQKQCALHASSLRTLEHVPCSSSWNSRGTNCALVTDSYQKSSHVNHGRYCVAQFRRPAAHDAVPRTSWA